MPLQRVVVGDSLLFEVNIPYERQQQQDLLLVFLRSPAFPGSGAFTTAPDSLAAFTRDRQAGAWVPVGGIGLDLFTTAVHLDDFDRNGRPDLFVEWYTGGNGAASSGGAIYEFRFEQEDRGIRTTFHSDTSVSPVDLDRDGIWEFAVADEYWGLARAHYQAARYWSRIYRPDPVACGYALVNDRLPERVWTELCRPVEDRLQSMVRVYTVERDQERAMNVATVLGEAIAWRIAGLDADATTRYIDGHADLLGQILPRLELPVRDIRGLKEEAVATIARIREETVHPRFAVDPVTFDAIREAAVRGLASSQQGLYDLTDAIVLLIHDGDEMIGRAPVQTREAGPGLIARLTDLGRDFVPDSACENRIDPSPQGHPRGNLFIKGSDQRVIRFYVGRIRYRDPESVTIEAGYYWGGMAAAGMNLIVRREGEHWTVIGQGYHWIS